MTADEARVEAIAACLTPYIAWGTADWFIERAQVIAAIEAVERVEGEGAHSALDDLRIQKELAALRAALEER
jgi:hypothetical protein